MSDLKEAPKRPEPSEPGLVLLASGNPHEAIPFLEKLVTEKPTWENLTNLGVGLRLTGDLEAARKCLEGALALDVNHHEIWHNLANVHTDLGDFERAYHCLTGARKLAPANPHVALGMACNLLRRGQWHEAWPLWELGRYMQSWQPIKGIRLWSGEPLAGKRLLVQREGGYGDSIMYMRWFPELQDRGAHVTFQVWDRQAEFLEGHPWINRILPASKPVLAQDFDYQVALMSIPSWLGAHPSRIPTTKGGYLWGDPTRVAYGRNGKPVVGLCWAAEENGQVKKQRSITESELELLSSCPVEWVSLCPGLRAPLWVKEFVPGGWKDTASMMTHLDAVVTVDTAIAHMAGAMDIKTFVLLPCCSDWRWFTGTNKSPWYESVTVLRSIFPGRFINVLQEAAELIVKSA